MVKPNQLEINSEIKNYELIVNLYNTQNFSIEEIAEKMTCNKKLIFKILQDAKDLGFSFTRPLILPKALMTNSSGDSFVTQDTNRAKIFQSIKNRIESKSELDKYYEKEILSYRKKGIKSSDIANTLKISKSKVESLTRDMNLRGVPIHGYNRKVNSCTTDNELIYANLIDKYIDDDLSLSQIVNLIGISRATVQNVIYKYLI
jgi:predicted DNA-binding protein YlxM (UPF0122 family)